MVSIKPGQRSLSPEISNEALTLHWNSQQLIQIMRRISNDEEGGFCSLEDPGGVPASRVQFGVIDGCNTIEYISSVIYHLLYI